MLSLRMLLMGAVLGLWGVVAVAAGPAAAADEPSAPPLDEGYEVNGDSVWDPIEPVNRGFFWVNDKLYFYFLKPVARGYRAAVPEPGRVAVRNVFRNLDAPVRIVNNALQGKVVGTLDELAIFLSNSIFGLGGIIDLHADSGKPSPEDFGQTLGYYGVPAGPYLVLPIIGSRNLRDGAGQAVDRLVDPIPSPYYLKMSQLEIAAITTGEQINHLSLDKDSYEAVLRDSLDPYVTIRDAYMQNRAAKVAK
ncbi:MAG: VacJ family lipoprotein [Deltaproteobacteria bacterium]|nr:MAG: VacJ family lipoprotein [Deltaproteobacteria bacterium]